MAFCSNCGNEIPEGTKFCPNCGTQVASSAAQNTVAETQNIRQQNVMPNGYQQNMPAMQPPVQKPQKKRSNKFGKSLGIILLILVVIYLFSRGNQSKKDGLSTPAQEKNDTTYAAASELEEAIKEEEPSEPVVTKSMPETETSKETDNTVKEEQAPAEPEKTEEAAESKPQEKEQTNGVDPDLKAFLDSYEDFVDEYVDFMKKYNSDPNNMIAMLGEYSDIMQKYSDFAEKIDKYDSSNLSTEDYKYYIEVTTRCSQKMLDVY